MSVLLQIIPKKGKEMRQIENVMKFLRERNRLVRPNNLKINGWVDEYIKKCFLAGEPINILTQWCLSKSLERRFREQGNKFVATKGERRVLQEDMPRILEVFADNGFRVNWLATFNRSYLDSRMLPVDLETSYKQIVLKLASGLDGGVLFADWEEDVLGKRSPANQELLVNFDQLVGQGRFDAEFQRWSDWEGEQTDMKQSKTELADDVRYQITCEAQEARLLIAEDSFFSGEDFVIFPLEAPERYDNFTIFVDGFKKRLVSVLTPYPWRA